MSQPTETSSTKNKLSVDELNMVVSFIQFLRQKGSKNKCTEDQEGLEIAIKCLESVFGLTEKSYAFQPSKPLDIFKTSEECNVTKLHAQPIPLYNLPSKLPLQTSNICQINDIVSDPFDIPAKFFLRTMNSDPIQDFDYDRSFSTSPDLRLHQQHANAIDHQPQLGPESWQETPVLAMDNPPIASAKWRIINQPFIVGCKQFREVHPHRYYDFVCQVIAVIRSKEKVFLRVWDGTRIDKFSLFSLFNDLISKNDMLRWDNELLSRSQGLYVDVGCYDEHGTFAENHVKPGDFVYLKNVRFYKLQTSDRYYFTLHQNTYSSGTKYERRIEILSDKQNIRNIHSLKKKLEEVAPTIQLQIQSANDVIPISKSNVITLSDDEGSMESIT